MKTTIKTKQGSFRITSEYIGNTAWPATEGHNNNYHNHKIRVFHSGKIFNFDYWGSIMNPEIQSDEDNISAFEAFVSDAICGESTFEDFCSDLGYDTDSRRAERIYKACQKSNRKLHRIFSGNIYELLTELQNYESKSTA